MDLKNLTITKARKALDAKEFSAVDLASAYLTEIEKKNPELNAYLEVYDDVLEQAKTADQRIAKGESHPLLGIPLAIKDNIVIDGKRATSASKILQGYVAPYDATVIEKLKKDGVILLGRTNMDEFALGSSTENSAYGVTKNSYDLMRVSGGTSGGSAVAVSSNMALAGLGSDTGGSVRQPASFCGVVGLKPTYGRVSRYGLMAAVSSFDQIGPITKTVEDAEIVLKVIKGKDSMDSTTITDETYPKSDVKQKYTIGVPWDLIKREGIDLKVKENFKEAINRLESFGFEVKDIKLPNCLALYYIINFAEVSSNLSRFDGVKYGLHVDGKNLLEDYILTRGQGFGREVRRRILLGTFVLSAGYYDAYYGKAQLARVVLQKEFKEVFSSVDLVLTPTSPVPAWKIGEKSDPLSMYLADIFTVPANIVGIPAISVPSGFMEVEGKKLPLGIQFMAPHSGESVLFDIGKKFLGEK
ncbi:MAG: glutaminyl-tRNA synthase (glutamine-hydrolyzing) subunit A [Candidatus Zambryskibacteria bacterium RIFCSPLOWO2_12_FULL_39_45]|uniref:Glutamyl-tRNA(Gln) amidotransferase subunit A n=3 Tax=Candidatus Zambryskiibacteriota TaxID=1817925 RepID=A0A1G2T660_9BACT|nr:MAG: glutaminyl-tRNA synthase (glutamine-hydrolyzing) subunit A [Candidatus Zambryskibacteria bacterium RIFCSPHIGHO2_02_38_10.5]OHA96173.1 MAG: glutaminyl-tRNA synthase (glutamine-hydrolyzing) subunit A [Candidatus Zambryskibacteria bacterium RIFCSPHIGHO2_02_FULL_39_82]OHA97611.1 MAG: glutaminyl-tRNA synthase (glutamine-hydrolyzing) subunit A [Candidatus Zambryskibacteria bacterium RIFCSPHIGHO2_12_FULL_38_37]OHB08956.1 MAG: glutaminyl-tRNA synthase (glutamine-hydrolyzing) subunit A [Candidatu